MTQVHQFKFYTATKMFELEFAHKMTATEALALIRGKNGEAADSLYVNPEMVLAVQYVGAKDVE